MASALAGHKPLALVLEDLSDKWVSLIFMRWCKTFLAFYKDGIRLARDFQQRVWSLIQEDLVLKKSLCVAWVAGPGKTHRKKSWLSYHGICMYMAYVSAGDPMRLGCSFIIIKLSCWSLHFTPFGPDRPDVEAKWSELLRRISLISPKGLTAWFCLWRSQCQTFQDGDRGLDLPELHRWLTHTEAFWNLAFKR